MILYNHQKKREVMSMKDRYRIFYMENEKILNGVVYDTLENVLKNFHIIYLTDIRGYVIIDNRKVGKLLW